MVGEESKGVVHPIPSLPYVCPTLPEVRLWEMVYTPLLHCYFTLLAPVVRESLKKSVKAWLRKKLNYVRIGGIPPSVETGILNVTNNLGLNCTLGSI